MHVVFIPCSWIELDESRAPLKVLILCVYFADITYTDCYVAKTVAVTVSTIVLALPTVAAVTSTTVAVTIAVSTVSVVAVSAIAVTAPSATVTVSTVA